MTKRQYHDPADREFTILQLLGEQTERPQRDIARHSGMSLGMVNLVLKRLADAGLIRVNRLDARHLRYALTPTGVRELARRSYRFFRRTVSYVRCYEHAINELAERARDMGFSLLELKGESDVAFLIQQACGRHKLELRRSEYATEASPESFVVYGERVEYRGGSEGRGEQSEWIGEGRVLLWPILEAATRNAVLEEKAPED